MKFNIECKLLSIRSVDRIIDYSNIAKPKVNLMYKITGTNVLNSITGKFKTNFTWCYFQLKFHKKYLYCPPLNSHIECSILY